jgi:hypothetical protein
MRLLSLVAIVTACNAPAAVALAPTSTDGAAADLSAAHDLSMSPIDQAMSLADLAMSIDQASPSRDLSTALRPDLAPAPPDLGGHKFDLATDGGAYMPPGTDDSPLAHAAPSAMNGAVTVLRGLDVLDVSTDQGGGVWAVTSAKVYYLTAGGATYTYDQSSGLARRWYTWNDTYYGYGANAPVTFASVAGGVAGEAIIGNIGAIADRMVVNSSTGAVSRIDNMQVVPNPNLSPDEQQAQLVREVAMLRVSADLNGTFDGTAYLGGFHGFSAFHGIAADCGCTAFEQHLHAFPAWAGGGIGGADVRGLAFSPAGDVWQGDRDMVGLWPQRSLGPRADFFQDVAAMIDVFPSVRDEVWGLGVDHSDGVYVASYGNGLAYLSPASHQPVAYWSRATTLPQNHLTDVTVDGAGEVWVATVDGGAARFNPASNAWSYYTTASGLAANNLHRVYFDQYSSTRTLYFATGNGVTVFRP